MRSAIRDPYTEERQRLAMTISEIERQRRALKDDRYYGDDFTEQVLDERKEMKRRTLDLAAKEPYFGRLDYQEAGQEKPTPLYIGKFGVENDTTNELLVVDWRAPVASLFYSFTGGDGPAVYESPDGVVEGIVHLKRNIVIRQQTLQRVVDSYVRGGDNLGIADEFLLYRLGENKDNRLRDIVSTIQEEQDRIIRSDKNTALVIQGVAGSGKTTVALHRIAYLLYQYRETMRAEKMIIFAPNRMFLDYISNVLPELGVGEIQQTTFADWAIAQLDCDVRLADPSERLSEWFSIGPDSPVIHDEAPGRFKGSIRFMRWLDDGFRRYEAGCVPDKPFEAWDGAILPADTIRQWFYDEYRHYPLMQRRQRVINRIERWLRMELDQVKEPRLKKDLKKKAGQRLKAYLKQWPEMTSIGLYKLFFAKTDRPDHLPPDLLAHIPDDIVEQTNRNFKKNEIQFEDLAPLLYIRGRLHGIEGSGMFDHVVIDEAQDFSPFQVALLMQYARGNSFTILGDLSQGIHAYQGIRSWREFLDLFGSESSGFYRLERSYRSTMEIIEFANEVIAQCGEEVTLAKPVFRSGEKVNIAHVPHRDRTDAMIQAVRRLWNGSANTVAVIGRTEEECRQMHEAMTAAGLTATLITAGQSDYGGGISVLPVYLSKGLEFDAVLIMDADSAHYANTAHDAKLLYVGCTRALHSLSLMYSGEPSPLIRHLVPSRMNHEHENDGAH